MSAIRDQLSNHGEDTKVTHIPDVNNNAAEETDNRSITIETDPANVTSDTDSSNATSPVLATSTSQQNELTTYTSRLDVLTTSTSQQDELTTSTIRQDELISSANPQIELASPGPGSDQDRARSNTGSAGDFGDNLNASDHSNANIDDGLGFSELNISRPDRIVISFMSAVSPYNPSPEGQICSWR